MIITLQNDTKNGTTLEVALDDDDILSILRNPEEFLSMQMKDGIQVRVTHLDSNQRI